MLPAFKGENAMSKMRRMRRAIIPGCLLFLAAALPAQAQTTADAQDYVQTNIQTGLSILQDKSVSDAMRRERIHSFLLSLLDTKRIALYTLGSAQQTASPSDVAAFIDAFRDFMVANYDSRLGGYNGQTLKVTASVEHAPGDFVVSALLVDPSAAPGGEVPEVDLRVVSEGGAFYVVDACIEGIWLDLAQRNDFQGFLKEHNGDVAALTAHLKDMTAKLQVAGN